MRKKFETQPELDAISIGDIKLHTQSRHELPPLLAGLQYIFLTPELNHAIFELLETHLVGDTKKTGRLGMSLWEIFVLGTVRLVCNYDYDHLLDIANDHRSLRGILGILTEGVFKEHKLYKLQTLKDNVGLLTEDLLDEINIIIVKAGHDLIKKKEGVAGISLEVKADSYVAESNVAFPTDFGLLYVSMCKCFDIVLNLLKASDSNFNKDSWRKHEYNLKKLKKAYRKVSNIHRRKGKNYKKRLKEAVEDYLKQCEFLSAKIANTIIELQNQEDMSLVVFGLSEALKDFHSLVEKHIDLVDRRILKGETIPHEEKIFSIFERHVEWINKGKANGKVELGHAVLIATDQYHFIIRSKVLVGEVDSDQVIPLTNNIAEQFPAEEGYTLARISFDRGFYSKPNEEHAQTKFDEVIMPKKGGKSEARKAKEESESFVAGKNAHSAVESNINELNHCGVKKVPDKGLPNFKKYTALGVCAYNLKRLGRMVIEQKKLHYLEAASTATRKAA